MILPGLIFWIVVGLLLVGQCYYGDVIRPKREAKRTGRNVVTFNSRGGRVFRPDGSSYTFRSY